MKRSGRGGSGPDAANVPSPTPTTLFNLSSLSFFSSSNSRSRPNTGPAAPATTGGVTTFANGATFGDPFQPYRDNSNSPYTRTQLPQPRQPQPQTQPQQQQQQRQRQRQQQQSPRSYKGLRRRANSSYSLRDRNGVGAALGIDTYEPAQHGGGGGGGGGRTANDNNNAETVVIDNGQPPALPDFALSSAAKLPPKTRDAAGFFTPRTSTTARSSLDIARGYFQSPSSGNARMLSRTGTGGATVNGFPTAGGMMAPPPSSGGAPGESNILHQHIQELANKRISTLEYLRKAYVPFPSQAPLPSLHIYTPDETSC